jgi:rhamnosyl/mannosyltransferase
MDAAELPGMNQQVVEPPPAHGANARDKVRVLHFFKTYWPDSFGGIERTIHAISRATAPLAVTSSVLSLSRSPADSPPRFDGHAIAKARLDLAVSSTGFSREAPGMFRRLAAEADIIHYHFPWPFMDVVHFMARPRQPTLVTYHSDIVRQRFLRPIYSPLMHAFLDSATQIVCTSPNYLQSSRPLQRYRSKTEVIPIGIEDRFHAPCGGEPRKVEQELPARYFLFVGVLRYYKGLEVLIEAAKLAGLPVVIVGDGPVRGDLVQRASGADNVRFLHDVDDDQKFALLRNCQGFVFPSHQRSEAFGIALLEAAMMGRPMISCEIGTGTSYINLHRQTGLVVPPNDPPALASAMLEIDRNRQQSEEWGRAARKHYLSHFTADQMGMAYARLYRDLLKR